MTKIEWTDETWNPIAGCNDKSEGCRNCYARGMAGRLEAMGVAKYAGLTVLQGSHRVWTGKISFDEKALLSPLGRKKPTRYFVNSMSDLFHENVTDEMLDKIVAVAAVAPWHTMQCLTKRPANALRYWTDLQLASRIHSLSVEMVGSGVLNPTHLNKLSDWHAAQGFAGNPLTPSLPLRNWQQGVSVEDQKTADERIPLLLQTPAAVRFISAEPLLGPINLAPRSRLLAPMGHCPACVSGDGAWPGHHALGSVEHPVNDLDWVICGGESGPGARPMHPDWARSLRDQCVAAGVPFFFKQWGEWIVQTGGVEQLRSLRPRTPCCLMSVDGHIGYSQADMEGHVRVFRMLRVGKKAAGHLLDGKEWHQFPEVPNAGL